MFTKKNLFCMVVCFVVIISMSLSVCGAVFNDTEGHWAEETIDKWADMGVITGYEGNFNPDTPIIRGEFAVIIDRLMKYTETSVNTFSDLDKDAYYTEAILKLNKMSVMLGYNGKVSPEEYLTREEAFVMLNRVFEIKGEDKALPFSDASEISDWALDAVKVMHGAGIINGNENNMVCPQDNITRAEVIQLLDNIGNLKNENDASLIPGYVPNISGLVVNKPSTKPDGSKDESGDEDIIDAGKIQW